MKKSIKRTTAAILAVASTAGIASATSLSTTRVSNENNNRAVAYAEGVADGYTLKISDYKKTINLNDTFQVPTAYFKGASGDYVAVTNYKVTTPTNATLTPVANQFKVEEIGTYTISYTDASGNYHGEITFDVQTSSYDIAVLSNDSNILPSKMANDYVGELNIPGIKVTQNGKEVDSSKYNVKVSVTDPSYTTTSITNGKLSFTEANPAQIGYYIVTYTVYENKDGANGALWGEATTEFNVVSKDKYSNSYELTLKFEGNKPDTVNVGKTIELPSVSAKNDTESVPVNYSVVVYKTGSSTTNSTTAIEKDTLKVGNTNTYVLTKNENGVYEFTADEVGVYYRFVYTATDALGNTQTKEYSVENASVDTIKPTPLVVNPYNKETDDLSALKNEDHALKFVFANGEDVVIKAIYAEDLATFNYSDYTFERIIETSNTSIYREVFKSTNRDDACKDIVFDQSGANLTSNDTRLVATKDVDGATENIKLADGTYYVHYKVTDANGNTKEESYKFKVDSKFDWTKDEGTTKIVPTIKFNDTFYTSIDLGETIEFGEISVIDDYDERPESRLFYKYTTASGEEATERTLELNEDGKYVIDTGAEDVPEGATSVKIYAQAKNDGYSITNEMAEEVKTIQLKSTALEGVAPTIYEVQDSSYSYERDQGDKITLPTLVFQNGVGGVDSLSVDLSIKCTTQDDKTITYKARDAVALKIGNYLYYSNASFRASTAGDYQVAVKVTDAKGNVIIKFLNYEVNPTTVSDAIKFENLAIEDTTIELGETYKLQPAEFVGNKDLYDYTVICVEGPSNHLIQGKSEFIAKEVGEYKLQYVLYEKADHENIEAKYDFTITVQDTKGPQIHVDWQTEKVEIGGTVQDGKRPIEPAYDIGTKILIPKFSALDASGIDAENSKITIATGKHTYTIKYSDMNDEYGADGNMYLHCQDHGEYEITYTAVDLEGNKSTLVKTIKIGDLVPPTLTVKDEIVKSSYKAGKEFSIDLADTANYIFTEDNKGGITKNDIKITLYDPSGKEVKKTNESETIYSFKVSDAGEYELKFSVTDKAGLTTEVVKKFTVTSDETTKMTTNEIVGTVLIVVSVAVLAGVVVYFIISKRKMDKLYKG